MSEVPDNTALKLKMGATVKVKKSAGAAGNGTAGKGTAGKATAGKIPGRRMVTKRKAQAAKAMRLRRARRLRPKVIAAPEPSLESKTLQIVTVRESQGRGVTKEKLLECADKLQKKYLRAQKAMCSTCKGQPLTTVYTSFKVEGQEKEVEMRALIVDLESLAQAGIPGMEKYLNLN